MNIVSIVIFLLSIDLCAATVFRSVLTGMSESKYIASLDFFRFPELLVKLELDKID